MADHDLNAEFTAMQDIATLLNGLDQPTRARVLHWVMERFQGDAPFLVPAGLGMTAVLANEWRTVEPVHTTDESLAVGPLTDLFAPYAPAATNAPNALAATNAPAMAMASTEGGTLSATPPTEGRTPSVTASTGGSTQSITGMLQELAAEFQDLAREWNGPDAPPSERPSVTPQPSAS